MEVGAQHLESFRFPSHDLEDTASAHTKEQRYVSITFCYWIEIKHGVCMACCFLKWQKQLAKHLWPSGYPNRECSSESQPGHIYVIYVNSLCHLSECLLVHQTTDNSANCCFVTEHDCVLRMQLLQKKLRSFQPTQKQLCQSHLTYYAEVNLVHLWYTLRNMLYACFTMSSGCFVLVFSCGSFLQHVLDAIIVRLWWIYKAIVLGGWAGGYLGKPSSPVNLAE